MEEVDEATIAYLNSFPPGYRFFPTDIELVVYYLMNKVLNRPLPPNKIRAINLYMYSPQELSDMCGSGEGGIMYFFTSRDRKYPNGNRPNRAAGNGYWKATGIDKVVGREENPIGYKKALVYYQGNHKDSKKTNWIMQEYRIDQKPPQRPAPDDKSFRNMAAASASAPPNMKLDDWVLCKVYLKANKLDRKKREGSSAPRLAQGIYNAEASTSSRETRMPNNMGFMGYAPPMPAAGVAGWSTNTSSVHLPQYTAPIFGFSNCSRMPRPQYIAPSYNIGSTSSAPPMPAALAGFFPSTSSVPRPQYTAPSYIIGSPSCAPPMPVAFAGFSPSPSSVPRPQYIEPNYNMGSASCAPPMMQMTNRNSSSSSNVVLQQQPLYLDYFPSSIPEEEVNSFLTVLDDVCPSLDEITGPKS